MIMRLTWDVKMMEMVWWYVPHALNLDVYLEKHVLEHIDPLPYLQSWQKYMLIQNQWAPNETLVIIRPEDQEPRYTAEVPDARSIMLDVVRSPWMMLTSCIRANDRPILSLKSSNDWLDNVVESRRSLIVEPSINSINSLRFSKSFM